MPAVRSRPGLRRLVANDLEPVAEGVHLLRGGVPSKTMYVFFIEDEGGGVTLFDAATSDMAGAVAAAAQRFGAINRIVLGHAHSDHRGTAAHLDVPVLCHPLERPYAEAEHGANEPYFDFTKLDPLARRAYPRLLTYWDGGAVRVTDTVEEGDEVSGFRVVHIPGHAPGQIALFRDADRLALSSDCFYTTDLYGRHGAPRVPHPAFNIDTEQARASIRKLAALEPALVWPSHADPVTGDVRSQLEQAAAAT
jgi:glyoxylase-like metal-dependent hydrolase (beta-lactamase superfamily II)